MMEVVEVEVEEEEVMVVVVTSDGEWCLADTGLAAAELLPPPGQRPSCLPPSQPACQPASKYKRYAALSVVRGPATTCTLDLSSSLITTISGRPPDLTVLWARIFSNIASLSFCQKVRADPVCLRSEKVQSNRE